MNIITDIIEKIITLTNSLEDKIQEGVGLTGLVDCTKAVTDDIGRLLLAENVRTIEQSMQNSEERKAEWVVQARGREKTISTLLGDLQYERTYYKHRVTGEFKYLTDELLGLEPHQRIDTGLQADMLTKAKEMSYEQVVQSYENISIRSRSTIKNLVHQTSMEDSNWPKLQPENRKVRFLYIEADEDHVHQQKGKGLIMKLAYVHEGKRVVNPASKSKQKRKELIEAQYLSGLYPQNDDFWFEILDYLETRYDLDSVERIFLSGDGAPWIQAGAEILPKCVFVIDGYHLSKYIKAATGAYPGEESRLKRAVYSGNRDWVEAYFDTVEGNDHTLAERKRFASCRTYLLGNWAEIQNRHLPGYVECSAEGHVSHVLSHRLSSRPLSWSKLGAENIAKLRVYTRNGGSIRGLLNSNKEKKLETIQPIKLDSETLRKKKQGYAEFSTNITILDIGKRTTMYKFFKALRSA